MKFWHYILFSRLADGRKKAEKYSFRKLFPEYPVIKAIEFAHLLNTLDLFGVDLFDIANNGFDENEIKNFGIPSITKELLLSYQIPIKKPGCKQLDFLFDQWYKIYVSKNRKRPEVIKQLIDKHLTKQIGQYTIAEINYQVLN